MVRYFSKVVKYIKDYRQKRIFNALAINYYKKHKHKHFEFTENIWSRNILWDYFLQSLPHSIRSEYFVPGDYYACELEPKLNSKFMEFGEEKNLYEKIFSCSLIRFPYTILRCVDSVFFDGRYALVGDVYDYCKSIREDIIVKPTVHAGSGEGIRKYFYCDGVLIFDGNKQFDLEEITKKCKGNFTIQRIVDQHPEIASFHPDSLNTVRAFSYRSFVTETVHVPTVVLRMGVNHSYLDTVSYGAIACGITGSGKLMRYAFDLYGNCFLSHPTTDMRFEDFTVPAFDKIIRAIKQLANFIPHQRVAGWDFGVDKHNMPVLIEVNVTTGSWLMQIATGRPLFGKHSQEVKNYVDSLM